MLSFGHYEGLTNHHLCDMEVWAILDIVVWHYEAPIYMLHYPLDIIKPDVNHI